MPRFLLIWFLTTCGLLSLTSRTPTVAKTVAFVGVNLVFADDGDGSDANDAVVVLEDFVPENPSFARFDEEDPLAPAGEDPVFDNEGVGAVLAAEGDVRLDVFADFVLLDEGGAAVDDEHALRVKATWAMFLEILFETMETDALSST